MQPAIEHALEFTVRASRGDPAFEHDGEYGRLHQVRGAAPPFRDPRSQLFHFQRGHRDEILLAVALDLIGQPAIGEHPGHADRQNEHDK